MERWLSGRKRRFAKTLSTIFKNSSISATCKRTTFYQISTFGTEWHEQTPKGTLGVTQMSRDPDCDLPQQLFGANQLIKVLKFCLICASDHPLRELGAKADRDGPPMLILNTLVSKIGASCFFGFFQNRSKDLYRACL
jgi:hypothetical protein